MAEDSKCELMRFYKSAPSKRRARLLCCVGARRQHHRAQPLVAQPLAHLRGPVAWQNKSWGQGTILHPLHGFTYNRHIGLKPGGWGSPRHARHGGALSSSAPVSELGVTTMARRTAGRPCGPWRSSVQTSAMTCSVFLQDKDEDRHGICQTRHAQTCTCISLVLRMLPQPKASACHEAGKMPLLYGKCVRTPCRTKQRTPNPLRPPGWPRSGPRCGAPGRTGTGTPRPRAGADAGGGR